MSQIIIIIDSAEALAEDIRKEYIKNPLVNVKQAVLSCLHPIEVPNDAGELAREVVNEMESPFDTAENREKKAAALITARERVVPRAMLEEIYNAGVNSALRGTRHNVADKIAAKYGYRAE